MTMATTTAVVIVAVKGPGLAYLALEGAYAISNSPRPTRSTTSATKSSASRRVEKSQRFTRRVTCAFHPCPPRGTKTSTLHVREPNPQRSRINAHTGNPTTQPESDERAVDILKSGIVDSVAHPHRQLGVDPGCPTALGY